MKYNYSLIPQIFIKDLLFMRHKALGYQSVERKRHA